MFRTICGVFLAIFAGAAFAQANVGELSQQGGKKMSKEELQQLHEGGVRFKGVILSGAQFSQKHAPDGSVSGSAQNFRGSTGIVGKWNISDTGQLCLDLRFVASGTTSDTCRFVWKIGDKYYAAENDEPATVVQVRQFEK